MKTETLTSAVATVRNKLQPHFNDNVDIMLFDYDFFTALESFAKKEREKAKVRCIDYADKPDDFEGTMIKTSSQLFVVKKSAAPQSFDKDAFIEAVAKKFNIEKHKLKEVATASVKSGTPRTTYTVEKIDD